MILILASGGPCPVSSGAISLPERPKRSSQQSPKHSPKSDRKSAKTIPLTKAIAGNYEDALEGLIAHLVRVTLCLQGARRRQRHVFPRRHLVANADDK